MEDWSIVFREWTVDKDVPRICADPQHDYFFRVREIGMREIGEERIYRPDLERKTRGMVPVVEKVLPTSLP